MLVEAFAFAIACIWNIVAYVAVRSLRLPSGKERTLTTSVCLFVCLSVYQLRKEEAIPLRICFGMCWMIPAYGLWKVRTIHVPHMLLHSVCMYVVVSVITAFARVLRSSRSVYVPISLQMHQWDKSPLAVRSFACSVCACVCVCVRVCVPCLYLFVCLISLSLLCMCACPRT